MKSRFINRISSLIMVFIVLFGFIPINVSKASQEFFYVNNSKVNAHTGRVLVNTRVSDHGHLVRKIGDKIEGTTYYQIDSNGNMTGKPFICIEVGTQFSSYETYGKNASKYLKHGEYKNEKLKAFISYMNYRGMNNLPTLMQMAAWSILGQVKLDEGEATQILADFEKKYAENPNSNVFKGASLFEYRDSIYNGQRLISYNYEKINEYDLELLKESDSNGLTEIAKKSYKLDEAKYSVYKTKDDAKKNVNSIGVLVTDTSGRTNKLKLTTGIYFVKEISAPKGYKLDQTIYQADLTKNNNILKVKDSPKYDPLNIMLYKQGSKGRALKDAEFEVNYYDGIHTNVSQLKPKKTWKFRTNEKGYFGFDEKYKIGGDKLFIDSSGVPIGLIGTYEFIETKAPKGYKINNKKYLGYVKDDGDNKYTGNTGAIYNAPKILNDNQKLIINKVDMYNKENIHDVARFKLLFGNIDISSKLMGENGVYTYVENATSNVEIKTNKLGKLEIKGIPNGKYQIIEIKAPKGFIKTDKNHTVFINNEDLELTIENEKKPLIFTKSVDKFTGKKSHNPTRIIEIRDTVELKNLLIGREYTINGTLVDKSTGEVLRDQKGDSINSKTKFTAEKENGTIDLIFKIPRDRIVGKEIVVFEKLFREERLVAIHNDISDKNQTTKVEKPTILTKFVRLESNEKIINPVGEVELLDIVEYSNLVKGDEYKLKLVIMDKKTNKPLKINDKVVKNEIKFIAPSKNGKISVPIVIDTSKIKGKTLVAFEDLYYKDEILTSHKDLNDDNQTIKITNPIIRTNSSDSTSGKKYHIPTKLITIKDEVTYKDLIVGKKYTLKGKLIDKKTNKVVKNKKGDEVKSEITFIPKTNSGKIEFLFHVEGPLVKGKETVVFEDLYFEDKLLISHADINDKLQTTKTINPQIKTNFFEKNSKKKEIFAGQIVELIDFVKYNNLLINQEYKMEMILMNKATNKPLLDKNGKIIKSIINFTPKTESGTIEIPIKLNTSNLSNQEIVAFEKLYFKDNLISSHEDINDLDQTVKIKEVPTINHYDNPKTGDTGILGFVSIILASIFIFLFTTKSQKS